LSAFAEGAVKQVFASLEMKKNYKFYVEKKIKIEKRLRDCKNVLADDKTKCEIDGGEEGNRG